MVCGYTVVFLSYQIPVLHSFTEVIVGHFNLEGLRQLQNCFVADEDLRGQHVLLSTSLFAT